MKFNRPNLLIDLAAVVCVIVIIFLSQIPKRQHTNHSDLTFPNRGRSGAVLMANHKPVPDTLTFKRYTRITDSIKMTELLRDGDLGIWSRWGIDGVIAASRGQGCDSCFGGHLFNYIDVPGMHELYYFELPGWTLNNDIEYHDSYQLSMFYVKNDTGYVRGYKKDLPVKFRYSHKTQHILIPVDHARWSKLNVLFSVIFFISWAWRAFLVVIFFLFLVNISKGRIFIKSNLFTLSLIALTLLILPVLKIIATYLMPLIFKDYFTAQIVANTDVFEGLWKIMAGGIVTLFILKAFIIGKQLTEEQELTI